MLWELRGRNITFIPVGRTQEKLINSDQATPGALWEWSEQINQPRAVPKKVSRNP